MLSSEFNRQYSRLNKEQKSAVDNIEGPVIVIAGPGTGKTTILTLRIAQILRKTDTPTSGILAITYTDAGVKAMKEKLRSIIGAQADEVRIHTFHSFAVSVIRDYPDHFPHLSNTEPITDIEMRDFIARIISSKKFKDLRPFGRPDMYIDPILKAISESKKEAYTPEMIKIFGYDEIKKITKDPLEYSTRGATKGELKADAKKRIQKCERSILLADVYERYEKLKIKNERIDFDDMIFELSQALRKDKLLLRLLQEQFLYLLVDEHQDTNDSQNMLVLMIAEFFDTPNVFIVGDEKQAIYRFQGASVENFLKFKREWRNVKLIQLDKSYRSHQKILDAGFDLIEHNYIDGEYGDLRVQLLAGNKEKEKPITVVKGENISDTEEYFVRRIKEILTKEPDVQIAVIVRTNSAVGRLKRLCENRGIQATAIRNVDIFEHPAGRLFFDLLSAVLDPLDVESLGKTIAGGLWGITFEEQIESLREIRAKGKATNKSLSKKLLSLRDSLFSGDPIGFLFEIAQVSGYVDKISLEGERVEIWRGILVFAESILRSRNNSSDALALIKELIAYRGMAEQKHVKVVSGDISSQVKIMTAHGSKGLEFDYVFIPYATESFWIKKSHDSYFALPFLKTSDEEEIKDLRRLFYVALTRARKHVEILTHAEMEGGEVDLTLRFIDELGKSNLEILDLKKMKKEAPLKIKEKDERLMRSYIEEAKRIVMERGLSVTALNHYLECPNIFLYRSVLRIPDLPQANAEKGTALHNALALVFKSKNRDFKTIEKILKKKTFEYLDNSLLNKFEIESLKENIEKEIRPIVAGLKELFLSPGKLSAEALSVGEVKISLLDGKLIAVPIRGRLDLVVEGKDNIHVFDYKTKKKMSEAEIRGKTKNAKGEYLRQLAFYALLLSQNPKFKNKYIQCSLIFLTPDERGNIKTVTLPISKEDIESVKENIRALVQGIYSGDLFSKECEDQKCEWCALRKISDK